MYDYLVVGAGFFGATFAWHAAQRGKHVLVIDTRDHVGGNCYTNRMNDIDIHVYGPHIFHTSDEQVWTFVNKFSKFNSYVHKVQACVGDKIYSVPINLSTVNQVFGGVHNADEAQILLDHEREPFMHSDPRSLEEFALSKMGKTLYELLFKHYTQKQWEIPPKNLPADIIKRLPIRLTLNDDYFSDTYQGIPEDGYTAIFERMLANIDVHLRVDFLSDKHNLMKMADRVVYTGSVDDLYDNVHDPLTYRTSELTLEKHNVKSLQGTTIVNYTSNDVPYTRMIEHKFFTPERAQKIDISWCSKETSIAWRPGKVRCYPVNDRKNVRRYTSYRRLMDAETKILFGGRLAEYKYADMHTVIRDAINLAQKEGLA
jgi:UDP-galactopyranose mutase